ncbi:MAG: DNA replication and repair protein RecF [Ignavibacteria bacterium CG_4_8_14_3_um_filter_37_9]|nr:DNA replication/repair protein RecF [Ignavibacteria bacterium]OIO15810.1 MAG: DNA recombination protein RecF [Ignavibacteria bacterium CG1_02_37_35]PIS44844.1 MAG: DNA replication and repair protein RecF [Ignavibacteria bacterium CG08_land_8_20_14_0_20_37_9]PIW98837.1 MAG: DNA replication and repair protein RecF [Ignavibacteria bacterium CG_4_8_14_3_um_filter_37_9]PIX93953.1 MAG: DNA replication and repair protein RecF [Ignavibacteria bacterium CG_4_10_14_3_um_filter_37_18]
MVLQSLQLKNYRIHTDSFLNFSNGINFIVGENGQGKTTILEAIYSLCTTKNFKASSEQELLQFSSTECEVTGTFQEYTSDNVRIYYSASENKRSFLVNGKQIYRPSEIIGKFPIVLLTPEDHQLTQGAPADRRKFVDAILSQSNPLYMETLLDYSKTIKHRSFLLNKMKEDFRSVSFDELEAWNAKMVGAGSSLIAYRKKFLTLFNAYLLQAYSSILNHEEIPFIDYQTTIANGEADLEKNFFEQLAKRKDEEIRRGTNLVGPHRDDFIFSINGKALRVFGSQGQHKTFQVALRFAQFFYMKDILGRTPIFLLDDAFGELDAKRAVHISNYIRNVGQAFITATDLANLSFLLRNENDRVIEISDGKVSYAQLQN